MARSILTNVDYNRNELQNARIQNLASAPSTPVAGQIYYDTTLNVLRVYTGGAWVAANGSDIPDSTITSAKIADGTIVNIDIASGAAIALSKLATDPLARANHTGTQAPATIQISTTDRLIGRDTAGAGTAEELTVGGGIEFTGTGIQSSAYTGEVTKAAGGTALTIANNAVVTARIADNNVTMAKIEDIATDSLIGRDTAGTGDPEVVTVTGGIEFTGTGSIRTSAFTGDVTKAAGGTALTIGTGAVTTGKIADANVTYAKIQNIPTDRLLGRDTAASGVVEEITVGGGLEWTGSGGIQSSAYTGNVTKTAGGTVLTIASGVVTNAMLVNVSTATIKGRATAGTGVVEDLTGAQVKGILAITAGDVSGFDTQVRTNRLDQMAVPTASVSMNTQKIINLLDPTNPQDAATKNYVDLARQGIRMKESVVVASTGALTLSGTQTIDGVAVTAGQRVLVKDQAAPAANGIYVVAAGAWTRDTDADTAAELADGATVWVSLGTVNANTTWSQINTLTTLGTDPQSWVQQGAATNYSGGNGISVSGGVISVDPGTGISVAGDVVGIDTAVVARKYNATVGDGAATAYVVTHSLANQWCTVQVFRNSGSFDQVECDIELTSANTVTLRFASAPSAAQYRVVITG